MDITDKLFFSISPPSREIILSVIEFFCVKDVHVFTRVNSARLYFKIAPTRQQADIPGHSNDLVCSIGAACVQFAYQHNYNLSARLIRA